MSKHTDSYYITEVGLKKAVERLSYLEKIERPEVIEAVQKSRALGDLRENGEYQSAKQRQATIDSEIRYLSDLLKKAKPVNINELEKDGIVKFGSIIVLENLDGSERKFQIVGEFESDHSLGLVSITAPIARILIGKRAGDLIEVNTPGGIQEFEIKFVN